MWPDRELIVGWEWCREATGDGDTGLVSGNGTGIVLLAPGLE